jgi:hypothetical protein
MPAIQGLLHRPARLQEAREVGAGPELGNLQVEGAQPRDEAALAMAIAPRRPLGAAFEPACADQPFHVRFHDQLQHALGDSAQEIRVARLRHQLGER